MRWLTKLLINRIDRNVNKIFLIKIKIFAFHTDYLENAGTQFSQDRRD